VAGLRIPLPCTITGQNACDGRFAKLKFDSVLPVHMKPSVGFYALPSFVYLRTPSPPPFVFTSSSNTIYIILRLFPLHACLSVHLLLGRPTFLLQLYCGLHDKISATEKLHGDRQQFLSALHEGVWDSGNLAPLILNLGFVWT